MPTFGAGDNECVQQATMITAATPDECHKPERSNVNQDHVVVQQDNLHVITCIMALSLQSQHLEAAAQHVGLPSDHGADAIE